MQFDKSVSLTESPDLVWREVTDLAVLAACLQGARLDSVDDEGRARGHMGVRIGSMLATFEGVAEILERDDDRRHLTVRASGTGAQGTAEATIVAHVVGDGDDTALQLEVTVDIAGALARLGQGMAEPVVDRLVDRFALALREHLAIAATGAGGQDPTGSGGRSQPERAAAVPRTGSDDPLDLGGLLLPGDIKRRVAIGIGLAIALVALPRLLRRPPQGPTIIINLGPVSGPEELAGLRPSG